MSTKFFILTLVGLFIAFTSVAQRDRNVLTDTYGAIIRGDTSRKEIALVFTGDEFGDGGELVQKTLAKHKIKGSFFLTGNFYSNKKFHSFIRSLKKEGHYLGAHSDKHLLYAPWTKRDSLLITNEAFAADLQNNYQHMLQFGIKKRDAPWFLPPFEWYNAEIVKWTLDLGLNLINFTPGTRSTADYTYPEMGKSYRGSAEIYQSIVQYEQNSSNGLNGFILLLHVGTDPRRTDKFYANLDGLLTELEKRGYRFLRINALLR